MDDEDATAPPIVAGFLTDPAESDAVQEMYDSDLADRGYVMNLTRHWAHQPGLHDQLMNLLGSSAFAASLTVRQRAILIAAGASTMGDSYCSMAWGSKLAGEAGADVAGGVLRGDDGLLDPREQALATWARQLAGDPNATTAEDVQAVRAAGYDDAEIVAISVYVGLRIAFSTVNDALGARPDLALVERAPAAVRDAVDFGRPPATT